MRSKSLKNLLGKIPSSFSLFHHTWVNFKSDNCSLYAAALTFITLLSLIPFLAFLFAIAKGLGIQNYIQNIILAKLALGKQQIYLNIIKYIQNTNLTTLGSVGIIFLFLVIIRLLSFIEEVFNVIWKVEASRKITRKISDYLSIVTLCPIFLFLAITFTATLSSSTILEKLSRFHWLSDIYLSFLKLLPFLSIWFAFCIFYMFMPNTKVNFSSALLAGIISGTLWQITQWLYLKFQIGIARYNAIYGTFASLPIFMIWLYVSWEIILAGAEFAFVHQNRKSLRLSPKGEITLPLEDTLITLKYLLTEFKKGKFPVDKYKLIQELRGKTLNPELIISRLINKGILGQRGNELYFLKDPANISLNEVLTPSLLGDEKLNEILNEVQDWQRLSSYKLSDLV
jgi:membrane protein